jgi:aminoglycoside 6'-N-acetyltransferase
VATERRERLALDPGSDDPEVGRWLAALEDARRDTLAELERVTPAMVDWYPDAPLNSIGTLLYHIALIEADWVASEILELDEPAELQALLPRPDRERVGDVEERRLSRVDGQPLAAHVERLAAVRAWAIERLRSMSAADFHRIRALDAYDVAPDWVLHHLLQHEAEHRSHIALLRDMYPQSIVATKPPHTAASDDAATDEPTLDGERVRLRPLSREDRDRMLEIVAEPEVARWWAPAGIAETVDSLYDPSDVTLAIEAEGRVAGVIQFAEENDPGYPHAGIDIFLTTELHGRGYGRDAIRTLARYLVHERGHHRITIDPAAANARAIRAYEAVGFRPVGVMRAYERGADGAFHDGLLMDLLRDELA